MLAKPPNRVLQKATASAGPAQAQLPDLVDHSEANRSRAAQGLGVVLHHALQARAALEGRLGGVFVLRVDKLCDQASCARQGGGIGAHPENELVDVACGTKRQLSRAQHGAGVLGWSDWRWAQVMCAAQPVHL